MQADSIAPQTTAHDWRRITSLLLRLAVFIHMVGLTYALYTRAGSSIGGVALMDWGVPHSTISFHERFWSMLLLVLATILLIRPYAILAFVIGIAILLDTAAAYRFGGDHFIEWVFYTRALRYGLPIALGIYLLSKKPWSAITTSWLLRVLLAVVFASHGLEALYRNPNFIDLIIGSTNNFTGHRLTEATAVAILKAIGIVDIIVAALILVVRWPVLLAWLCFWCLITAVSRVTTYGIMSFPEVLTRSTHIIAPIAVYTLARWEAAQTALAHSPSNEKQADHSLTSYSASHSGHVSP